MSGKEWGKQSTNDNILGHFIFIGIFLFEVIIKALSLIFSNKEKARLSTEDPPNIKYNKSALSNKTTKELRSLLKDIDILSSLNKDNLIELIVWNQEALDKFRIEERKSQLLKMTNPELRTFLEGVEKTSRLNKPQLVEMILALEQKRKEKKSN